MKKILLLTLFAFINYCTFAQLQPGLEGKKFTRISKTTTKSVTEAMGQEVEQINNTQTHYSYTFTNATANGYTVQETPIKMKIDLEMMGQEISYDSENPGNSPLADNMKDIINKPFTLSINKEGIVTDRKGGSAEALQMLNNTGMSTNVPADFILILPTDIAKGLTWKKKMGDKKNSMDISYTIENIENDNATITFKGSFSQSFTNVVQGMEAAVNQDGTISGKIIVNIKNNFVIAKTTKTEAKGTTDVMGMSLPVTSNTTVEDFYEY